MVICLTFIVFITPYEICFLGSASIASGRFWLNRIIDLLFLVDLVLQFFLIPPHLVTNSVDASETDRSHSLH